MQNKVRSQLSLIFKAPQLRRLERAIRSRNRLVTQSVLEELSGVPEGLKAAAQKLLSGFRPEHAELPPKQPASAKAKALVVPPPAKPAPPVLVRPATAPPQMKAFPAAPVEPEAPVLPIKASPPMATPQPKLLSSRTEGLLDFLARSAAD